ncbi:MAG: fibrobacter succinogenes major paralogous domain-containing protein [Bacteroidetes bacterium]|nr:fibrobacter succinogenes major paralogous domain-containing protein [Bacteroidota bacterium]
MEKIIKSILSVIIISTILLLVFTTCRKETKPPSVQTFEVESITHSSATSGGEIVEHGGEFVSARGVCWSTNQYPTISDYRTRDQNGIGKFYSCLSDLEPNTTYYIRAYATNNAGTGYGAIYRFITKQPGADQQGDSITDFDGNRYKTVWIGGKLWMAENLRTTHYNDGTPIPNITDDLEWQNTSTGAYCWYENDYEQFGSKYGALYNWNAVNTAKLCPVGWHVPSISDWTELTCYVGGEKRAGGRLMAPNGWAIYGSWDDEYQFSALPGGYRPSSGFQDKGDKGHWWSNNEHDNTLALSKYIDYYSPDFPTVRSKKQSGKSIRCVKD